MVDNKVDGLYYHLFRTKNPLFKDKWEYCRVSNKKKYLGKNTLEESLNTESVFSYIKPPWIKVSPTELTKWKD